MTLQSELDFCIEFQRHSPLQAASRDLHFLINATWPVFRQGSLSMIEGISSGLDVIHKSLSLKKEINQDYYHSYHNLIGYLKKAKVPSSEFDSIMEQLQKNSEYSNSSFLLKRFCGYWQMKISGMVSEWEQENYPTLAREDSLSPTQTLERELSGPLAEFQLQMQEIYQRRGVLDPTLSHLSQVDSSPQLLLGIIRDLRQDYNAFMSDPKKFYERLQGDYQKNLNYFLTPPHLK